MPLIAQIPPPPFPGFDLGPFQVRMYGLLIAIGALLAIMLVVRRYEDRGGNPQVAEHSGLLALGGGLLGARIGYIIPRFLQDGPHGAAYIERPLDILAIWQGGLAFFGAMGIIQGWIHYRYTRYEVHPWGVVVTSGWLTRRRVEITYDKVTDVTTYSDTLTVHTLTVADVSTYYVVADDVSLLVHNAPRPDPFGVPHGPGVYIIYLNDGNVYVGQAKNMAARWRQHFGPRGTLTKFGFTRDSIVRIETRLPTKGITLDRLESQVFDEFGGKRKLPYNTNYPPMYKIYGTGSGC
jgi:hypothetical protein